MAKVLAYYQLYIYRQMRVLISEIETPSTNFLIRARMEQIARAEIELAKRLYAISRQDSTIGYEATNHYYYRPLDLAEKVLNCDQVIRNLKATKG